MCGIAGYWSTSTAWDDNRVLASMGEALVHRGPDSLGKWSDNNCGVHLTFRRLAIIDTSQAGNQPIKSHCGQFILVFNGEIYNHQELRGRIEKAIPDINWRGSSDSETLVNAISVWGAKKAIMLANGMFAIAVWNRAERTLVLARDRFGEKPLYYGYNGNSLIFGSELKSLQKHPDWVGELDNESVISHLTFSCVPSPSSIYKNIHKLPPAHLLNVKVLSAELPEPERYWDIRTGTKTPLASQDARENKGMLLEHLRSAVKSRMLSDVPLGAFLSGGIDSSLVVALMQEASDKKVKTFTIGFDDVNFDEAPHAKLVADHLGTAHTELYVTSDDVANKIPDLTSIWDEPFADPSQIPTLMVSELARSDVTVCLSGDGGDELFCGYSRYQESRLKWSKLARIPAPLRSVLAGASAEVAELIKLGQMKTPLSSSKGLTSLLNRMVVTRPGLGAASNIDFYRYFVSTNKQLKLGAGYASMAGHNGGYQMRECAQYEEKMMYDDIERYLPNTILTKVDRASMSVSLEARCPLLDHELAEFAWQLPMSQKCSGSLGKLILRDVLFDYVPQEIVDRPKKGFGIPIEKWLRGPLKSWAEDLLSAENLRKYSFLPTALIRQQWDEHKSGSFDWRTQLWATLMLVSWLESRT